MLLVQCGVIRFDDARSVERFEYLYTSPKIHHGLIEGLEKLAIKAFKEGNDCVIGIEVIEVPDFR
jgi:hypothetical protein